MAQTRFVAGAALLLGTLSIQACSNDDSEPSNPAASGGSDASAATNGGTGGAPPAAQGGTGGTSASAGSSGTGGAPPLAMGGSGGTGGESTTDLVLVGTPTRPLLDEANAAEFELLDYLSSTGTIGALSVDNWDPTAGIGDVATFTSNFRVAATGGGTHTTVQAAIDAANAAGAGAGRQYIEVSGGPYREVVCVPNTAPPITLYSTNADASQTVIAFDNYSGKAKAAGTPANPCNANLNGETFGTSGSATFAAYANEFQAKNITFANDTDEATATGGLQAVALMTQADKVIFENVRVLGNQDSLYLRTPNVNTVLRVYFKGCYVEGDTDFIFGRATGVLDGCTIQSLTSRTASGVVIAPSTDYRNGFGILVINSTFTGDAGAAAGSTALGRAWDESQVDVATYTTNVAAGNYPNGQATVRNSVLGAHIQPTAPWRPAATTSRPFSSVVAAGVPANRLYEYGNTGPGSAAP